MGSRNAVIRKTGAVTTKDGKEKLYELVYWNAVQRCDPETCGCVELCSNPNLEKPCSIISGYMNNVYEVMIRTYRGEMTEDTAYRIGMHLVPLYKILCRLKMQEFSETSIMFLSKSGRKVNPIFEEIRKTVLAIEKVWQNLGYIVSDRKQKDKFVGNFNERSYYEVIESGGLPMLSQMNNPD